MMAPTLPEESTAPLTYKMWKAYNAQATAPDILAEKAQPEEKSTLTPATGASRIEILDPKTIEIPIFTDIDQVTGQIVSELGPFKLLNTVSAGAPSSVSRFILRMDLVPLEANVQRAVTGKSSVNYYHGGDPKDEIIALLSLAAGVRLKAGQPNRYFFKDDDPLGKVLHTSNQGDPRPPLRANPPIIARYSSSFCLNDFQQKLMSFINLDPQMASALMLSARCYQIGLWRSEEDPQYAWLSLVSAVECAANYHCKQKTDVVTALKDGMPGLYELLKQKDDPESEWFENVADHLKGLTGATKKFVDFLVEFWPDSPGTTAPHGDRKRFEYAWTPASGQSRKEWKQLLGKDLRCVYSWRSKYLHAGIAFPPPMLKPPMRLGGVWEERPIALAMSVGDNCWNAQDTPMLLHTFEHIVRGSLIKWWGKAVAIKP